MLYNTAISLALAASTYAWLPSDRELAAFNTTARIGELAARSLPSLPQGITKVRGVNLGGWLILEPWMVCDAWRNDFNCMTPDEACGDASNTNPSEADCMANVYGNDPDAGNDKFESHWSTWITTDDIQSIYDAGLNTIRIPIGYWSNEAIVRSDEVHPNGTRQLPYLDAIVEKAADLGMFVIMDLHGAPGRQQSDAFTGQNPNLPPYFFQSDNYGIAEQWLTWMTERIHSRPAYQKAVGMIEVLNEPVTTRDPNNRYQSTGYDNALLTNYYPNALQAVRNQESSMGVSGDDALHVMFMSEMWIGGDNSNPRTSSQVANDPKTSYDDHNYIGFNNGDEGSLMSSACNGQRAVAGQDYMVTGEWSNVCDVTDNSFLTNYFTAQQQLYEKPVNGDLPAMAGWIWWTWKTQLNDPRWDYSVGLSQGLYPNGANALEQNVYQDVCS